MVHLLNFILVDTSLSVKIVYHIFSVWFMAKCAVFNKILNAIPFDKIMGWPNGIVWSYGIVPRPQNGRGTAN